MGAYNDAGVVYYPCVVPLVIELMINCYLNAEVRWTRWKYKKKCFYTENWWEYWNQEFNAIYRNKTMASEDT